MELALFVWGASIIGSLATFIGVVGCITATICTVIYSVQYMNFIDKYSERKEKPSLKFHGTFIVLGVFMMFVSTLLPSQKTMYTMLGAYAGQSVVQSETADKVLKIVNGKLDEYLLEIEEKVKK